MFIQKIYSDRKGKEGVAKVAVTKVNGSGVTYDPNSKPLPETPTNLYNNKKKYSEIN